MTRNFNVEEMKAAPHVLGIQGTGWFLEAQSVLTAAHVVEAMNLSRLEWKPVEFRDTDRKQSILVRILRFAGSRSEKIAVLELSTSFLSSQALSTRIEPLVPDEPVASLAYPVNHPRFAEGRFVQYGADDHFAGTALLELYDGNDRLVFDHGASGAPVLDCQGRVVAIVSNILTRTIPFLDRVIRVSTPWQNPNVVSVPIQVLTEFAQAE